MAALNPKWSILAMSRKDPSQAAKAHSDISKFDNVKFVKADCLDVRSYPPLGTLNAIVHSVGSITDIINYKEILKNPLSILN